jgi:membrane-associated phospholipid phosphatase
MNDIFDRNPLNLNHTKIHMKARTVVYFSLAVIATCIISYVFFDIPVARFFKPRISARTFIFECITYFGKSKHYLIASAMAFAWFRFIQKRPVWANAAAFVFASVALSGIANELIKFTVGRSRPVLLLTQQIYEFKPFVNEHVYNSFPSGHANTAAALFYSLYLIRDRYWYIYVPIALAIMLSRVILDVHFLGDIIFGAYLAVVVTSLVKIAFDRKGLQVGNPVTKMGTPCPGENS